MNIFWLNKFKAKENAFKYFKFNSSAASKIENVIPIFIQEATWINYHREVIKSASCMKQARVWHLVRQYVRRHGPLSGVDSMSTRLLCLAVVHFFWQNSCHVCAFFNRSCRVLPRYFNKLLQNVGNYFLVGKLSLIVLSAVFNSWANSF